jgi:hypothetical protein
MFYHCKQDQAWVFTIRAVAAADRPKSECKHGWLMQSPITKAFNLEDVGPDDWKVWTESLKTADLAFTCNECFRDSDCGGVGTCTDRQCKCDDPTKHIGSRCQTEIPFCSSVEKVVYGENAIAYEKFAPFELVKRDESAILLYNRPAFSRQSEVNGVSVTRLIFYSGTRWFDSIWFTSILEMVLEHSSTKKDSSNSSGGGDTMAFHGYWYFDVTQGLFEVSDPTDSDTPAGIRWNKVNDNYAIGEAAPYGVAFPIKQDYVCYGKCEEDTCGDKGQCDEEKNFCVCDGVNGGNYCEFGLGDSYVIPLTRQFYLFFNEPWFNRSDYAYAEAYWADFTDAKLYGLLEEELLG